MLDFCILSGVVGTLTLLEVPMVEACDCGCEDD